MHQNQFGEGDYDQSERIIQRLLAEAGNRNAGHELVSIDAHAAEVAADSNSLKSPENHIGYDRTEKFVSPGGAALSTKRV